MSEEISPSYYIGLKISEPDVGGNVCFEVDCPELGVGEKGMGNIFGLGEEEVLWIRIKSAMDRVGQYIKEDIARKQSS